MSLKEDISAVRRCLENYLDRDGAKQVIVPVARIDRILSACEKLEKLLNFAASGHDERCSYGPMGCIKCAAREALKEIRGGE